MVPTGGDAGTTPALIVNSPQPAESVAGPSGFDFPSLFSTYRDLNAEIASCAATVTLLDQNGLASWNGTDPIAAIPLQPGQNILNLTGDQLADLDVINPVPGGVQPSDATTLVINVAVTGDLSGTCRTSAGRATSRPGMCCGTSPPGGSSPCPGEARRWGTIYAPNATPVDLSAADIEGNVVVRTLQEGNAAGANGGEIHYAPFENLVTNTGTTTLTDIAVRDELAGCRRVVCPVTTLAPGGFHRRERARWAATRCP
ncbi:hypothetical protein CC117_04975 [Parafrankia colletiae]|uniref:Choice-of-anchor A domain-containing protein n=1 Tax=Parafrankia colletiae TaxID=573497 RepID=A0A1S1QJG3_9ACTN|nr:hypothetical protein CC117_04975 [Parafrankia colletiae]